LKDFLRPQVMHFIILTHTCKYLDHGGDRLKSKSRSIEHYIYTERNVSQDAVIHKI